MSKVSRGPKSVKPKAIYCVNNWSSYNRALIIRGSLTLSLSDSVLSSWYYAGPPQRHEGEVSDVAGYRGSPMPKYDAQTGTW